jgi:hypothetical protein
MRNRPLSLCGRCSCFVWRLGAVGVYLNDKVPWPAIVSASSAEIILNHRESTTLIVTAYHQIYKTSQAIRQPVQPISHGDHKRKNIPPTQRHRSVPHTDSLPPPIHHRRAGSGQHLCQDHFRRPRCHWDSHRVLSHRTNTYRNYSNISAYNHQCVGWH